MSGRARVGVNLLWLVPGVVGGSEEYTTRLLEAFADARDALDGLDLTLFVLEPFTARYPELVASFETVVCPLRGDHKGIRVAAEATWLLAQARRRRIDLLHHAGGTIPVVRATPSIVTVHDLQPLLLPRNFSRMKHAYLRARLQPSVRGARLVITLTRYTARTISEQLGVPLSRIALVPPGYAPGMHVAPADTPAVAAGLEAPFFLFPAISYPHKNHVTLVRAFAEVAAAEPDVLLVLTHRADVAEDALDALARDLGVHDRVHRLGHVDPSDLDWLYHHAVALTFPSRFEGFGLPVLEAMGHGCPVIAANATALPEVVDDAGVLVDPLDVDAWAEAMLTLLHDDARRSWLAEAGFARAGDFRWRASAERLGAAYRRALAS